MENSNIHCAGIDTGKAWLDAAIDGRAEAVRVSNDEPGHRQLAAWLAGHGVTRVGIEATGGYERPVVQLLRAKGFTVVVFQPIQVRAFAGFHGLRAKNDRIDAALVAACTANRRKVYAAPDARLLDLSDHLTFIEQIEEDMVRLKTRLEAHHDPMVVGEIRTQLDSLKRARKSWLKHLEALIRQHADLSAKLALILSVPGVGLRTALAILVRMPEIGTLSREQAAALAGLAPFDRDSGSHSGQRHIAGGRARLRKALFAAALPAAFHWNAALKTLYARLTAAGKTHKVALVACARKLLIYANTVVARGTPWDAASSAR